MTMSKNSGNGRLSQPSQSAIDGLRPRAVFIAGLVVFTCAAVAWPLRLALAVEFVLIHNVKTGTNSVTKGELKDMAIGRKKAWPSGAPVQLVLQSVGTPEMKWFALFAASVSSEIPAA